MTIWSPLISHLSDYLSPCDNKYLNEVDQLVWRVAVVRKSIQSQNWTWCTSSHTYCCTFFLLSPPLWLCNQSQLISLLYNRSSHVAGISWLWITVCVSILLSTRGLSFNWLCYVCCCVVGGGGGPPQGGTRHLTSWVECTHYTTHTHLPAWVGGEGGRWGYKDQFRK